MSTWSRIVSWSRPVLAVTLVACMAATTTLSPVQAQSTATFLGAVIDPDGKPVGDGFTVTFRDVVGQKTYTAKTSAAGQYSVNVPVGGKYKLESVTAPDGTLLKVQDVPPLAVRIPGNNRLDVAFSRTAAPAPATAKAAPVPPPPAAPAPAPKAAPAPAPAPATAAAPAPQAEEKKKKSGVPWWKTPGGITGIVIGSVVAAALILGGGGGCNDNSPSEPGCQE